MRHWVCREAWFVACTCGVAVREGNTVLAVDMCAGKIKVRKLRLATQMLVDLHTVILGVVSLSFSFHTFVSD